MKKIRIPDIAVIVIAALVVGVAYLGAVKSMQTKVAHVPAAEPVEVPVPAKPEVKGATGNTPVPGQVVGTEITAENVFNATNQLRSDSNLALLRRNPKLDAAAQAKLADELSKGYFAHASPEGKDHRDWIRESGYVPTYSGENLATDFSTVQETVSAWKASPTHYANMVKPEYIETGIAVSGSMVVQMFATPAKHI